MNIFLKAIRTATNGIMRFFIAAFEVFYVRVRGYGLGVSSGVNGEHVEACRRLIKTEQCGNRTFCGNMFESGKARYREKGECECPGHTNGQGDKWACLNQVKSAHEWLAAHGIKE